MVEAARAQALERVSVVIPTHNRAQTLPRTLESVWEQTHRPIELVIVDDGSTDATREVVSGWAAQHHDSPGFTVRYLYQANAGANAARNRGIREARGAYARFWTAMTAGCRPSLRSRSRYCAAMHGSVTYIAA